MRKFLLMLIVGLGGCTSYDQPMATDFRPLGGGKFAYRGFADASAPLESPGGEQYRMQMLDRWLGMNNLCTSGYVIDSRQPVLRNKGLLGDVYDVHYQGHCKSTAQG